MMTNEETVTLPSHIDVSMLFNETNRLLIELQDTTRRLEERERDAQLAAELGQALLQDNNKLREQIAILSETIEQYDAALKVATQRSETFSTQESDQNTLEILQEENTNLLMDNQRIKSRNAELTSLYEESERNRYDLGEEFESMKKTIDHIRIEMHKDQEANKFLREMVETQKQALEESKKLEEENRKTINKLRDENNKLENRYENAQESNQNLQSAQTENVKLRRELSMKKKLEEDVHELASENQQLRDLVQDKEKMAESIQFLIEENKRYRKEHEEMVVLLEDAKRAASELKEQLEESLLLGESSSRSASIGSLNDDLEEEFGKFPKDILDYFAEHETEIKMYIEKQQHTVPESVPETVVAPTVPDAVVPTLPTSSIPTSPKRVLRMDSQPDITPESIPLSPKQKIQKSVSFRRLGEALESPTSPPIVTRQRSNSTKSPMMRRRTESAFAATMSRTRSGSLAPPPMMHGLDETTISNNMSSFRNRSSSMLTRGATSTTLNFDDKQYKMKVLENKLKTAESKLKDMSSNLEKNQQQDKILEELNKRLTEAEEKLRNKDEQIEKLQQELKKQITPSTPTITPTKRSQLWIKEGWLYMKQGTILTTWTKRYFILSSNDKSGQMYHAKTENEKVMGTIGLKGAYMQIDNTQREGKHCFLLISHIDRRNYLLSTDTQEEMSNWMIAIQERIDQLSSV